MRARCGPLLLLNLDNTYTEKNLVNASNEVKVALNGLLEIGLLASVSIISRPAGVFDKTETCL